MTSLVTLGFENDILDKSNKDQMNNDSLAKVDLEKGTEVMIFLVERLQGKIKSSPNDSNKINDLGDSLEENWDMIEQQIKANYPRDYQIIEKSLSPLIANCHNTPNIKLLKQLVPETEDKLNKFLTKISD